MNDSLSQMERPNTANLVATHRQTDVASLSHRFSDSSPANARSVDVAVVGREVAHLAAAGLAAWW